MKIGKISAAFLFAAVLSLAGCSGLLTSKQNVNQFYTLNALDFKTMPPMNVDATIVVESPSVSKGLDTNQIMLMRSPQRLDYYAGARWSSLLGNMVQSSVVEAFENSGSLSRVGSEHSSIAANYLLILDVRDFQAEYSQMSDAPTVHIKLVAKLVTFPHRQMVASFTAEVFDDAPANDLETIVSTFDEAFQVTQAMMLEEVLDYFAANPPHQAVNNAPAPTVQTPAAKAITPLANRGV